MSINTSLFETNQNAKNNSTKDIVFNWLRIYWINVPLIQEIFEKIAKIAKNCR
jgi:hypothetical protein